MSETRARRTENGTPPQFWGTSEADNAAKALADAMGGVGITIPSLSREYFSIDYPLIELGKVRPDVAVQLANALTELVKLREQVATSEKGDATGEQSKEKTGG